MLLRNDEVTELLLLLILLILLLLLLLLLLVGRGDADTCDTCHRSLSVSKGFNTAVLADAASPMETRSVAISLMTRRYQSKRRGGVATYRSIRRGGVVTYRSRKKKDDGAGPSTGTLCRRK